MLHHRAVLLYLTLVGMMMMIPTGQTRSLPNLLVRIDLERRASFVARQTGGGTVPQVPSQCQTICDPVNTVISAVGFKFSFFPLLWTADWNWIMYMKGCTPSSCCKASFETSYFNCFLCVGQALGLTDYSEIQAVLDQVVNECALLGNNLPKLTFPGQNPSRTVSAVPNLPSSTAVSPSAVSPTAISPSSVHQSTVSAVSTTPPPYQSTVTALPTSATSTVSTRVSSFGVRSAQSGMLGVVLAMTTMVLLEFFYLG